jgi:hypothetical protein
LFSRICSFLENRSVPNLGLMLRLQIFLAFQNFVSLMLRQLLSADPTPFLLDHAKSKQINWASKPGI